MSSSDNVPNSIDQKSISVPPRLEDLTKEYKKRVYDALDSTGKETSRSSLKTKLEVADTHNEAFSSAIDQLKDEGRIGTKVGGPGGSIWRIDVEEGHGDIDTKEDSDAKEYEKNLYVPIIDTLQSAWIKRFMYADDSLIASTADSGRKKTGGKWSRPDIVLVGKRQYAYLPNIYFDVVTFEVKAREKWDISSVYEAMSHRRRATHSYLILSVANNANFDQDDVFQSILREAEEQGIGLITFTDARDWDTWTTHVEAIRVDTDPAMLNEFLGQQLSDEGKQKVVNIVKQEITFTATASLR